MINPKKILNILKKNKIKNIYGVPDSNLKELLDSLYEDKFFKNIITVNEGSAIAMASGNYIMTNNLSLVYLQNSGLGNIINPLTSLANKEVYNIPILLFIGWRGSLNDEVQHEFMGEITKKILDLLRVEYFVYSKNNHIKDLDLLINKSKKTKKIVAVLFENNIFKRNLKKIKQRIKFQEKLPDRSQAVSKILENVKNKSIIVSSTGYLSREVFFQKNNFIKKKFRYIYIPGSMGYAVSVATAISRNNTKQDVIVLDGDGSFLMHLGTSVTSAIYSKKNFKYILFNNGVHEFVGCQKTDIFQLDLKKISIGLGYKKYVQIDKVQNFKKIFFKFIKSPGPSFLELKTKISINNSLPRIKEFS